MKINEIVERELENNFELLKERGFPILHQRAEYHRGIKIEDGEELDLLGLHWDESETLLVKVYRISDISVGAEDILPITIAMSTVARWLHFNKNFDMEKFKIFGAVIGSSMKSEGFMSNQLGGNVKFYSYSFDPYKGITFMDHNYYGYQSSGIDLEIEIPAPMMKTQEASL